MIKILKKNSNTVIGDIYDFRNINSLEDFKEKFPITDYSYYENYIERMAGGEKNILTSDEVEYFSHTSGTTGKQKLIPTTTTSRRIPSKYMAFLINRYAFNEFKKNWNYEKGLMLADITNTNYTKGGIPICSATSGGINAIEPILPYLYTSPIEVMKIKDKEIASYLHLLFALKEGSLLFINGVFISNVVDLFRVLEKYSVQLVRDIRRGRVSRSLNLNDESRKKLNEYLSPDANRADKLALEFNKGFKGIAKRVWPKLTYIGTVTGANFSIYDEMLNYYTDNLPVYSPVYAASEGTIGINPYVKKVEYVVIPDTVFYEFIEEKDFSCENPKTLCIDELKQGGIYEIILTNYSGLYRYRLGDVVKVVEYFNNTPSIEFLYRKNQALNMVAEKTTEEHLTNAILKMVENLKINLIDYTTYPDNSISPGRYIIYLEISDESKDSSLLEGEFDKQLSLVNLAYGRARQCKKLSRPKIVLVKRNTFNRIKELLINGEVSKNQIKIPRVVIGKEKIISLLKENIIK